MRSQLYNSKSFLKDKENNPGFLKKQNSFNDKGILSRKESLKKKKTLLDNSIKKPKNIKAPEILGNISNMVLTEMAEPIFKRKKEEDKNILDLINSLHISNKNLNEKKKISSNYATKYYSEEIFKYFSVNIY